MKLNIKKITKLEKMDRGELAKQWLVTIRKMPPKASSRIFLLRSMVYELQIKHNSDLKKSDLKALSDALSIKEISHTKGTNHKPTTRIKLIPGSRLVREWNNKIYTISVIEEGFVYKDKVWASLSAIAKDITGTHWSGPRFFGVKGAA